VFSYYPADYGLPGTSLVGPEFGILDTSTTYTRTNFMNTLLFGIAGMELLPVRLIGPPARSSITRRIRAMAGNPQQLVDALNARLMHGTMSAAMNANIVATVST